MARKQKRENERVQVLPSPQRLEDAVLGHTSQRSHHFKPHNRTKLALAGNPEARAGTKQIRLKD